MSTLNVVLVEPQIPQNAGNIARTCAVTGARLHLVGRLGFQIDDKKLKRAGLDYWNLLDISEFETYEPLGILVELARNGRINPWPSVSVSAVLRPSAYDRFGQKPESVQYGCRGGL